MNFSLKFYMDFTYMETREDRGYNRSSASPCESYEATEWGGPSDETGKTRSHVTVGVAR
jgi:hypothetical protein